MRVATASMKARSCETSTSAPRQPPSSACSQAMASRSRWLVGSSSSRTSGCGHQRLRQRDALLRAARERADVAAPAPGAGAAGSRRHAAPRSSRRAPRSARLQRVEVVAGGVRLVALRAARAPRPRLRRRRRTRWRRRRTAAPAARRSGRRPCCTCSVPSSALLETGQDLQQRRLAGAVAADQRDTLAGLEREARRRRAAARGRRRGGRRRASAVACVRLCCGVACTLSSPQVRSVGSARFVHAGRNRSTRR